MGALVRHLVALPEEAMRRAALLERLEAMGASAAADALAALVAACSSGDAETRLVFRTFAALLTKPPGLPYDFMQELYASAKGGGHDDLLRLLLAPPAAAEHPESPPPEPDKRVRGMTLGERKWMARRPDRIQLERLLQDPHPQVIRNLLLNRHITEQDVIAVITRRPAVGEVLREVFRCPRWIARYRVKLALARNPYTPGDIAARLLPMLRLQDLREVAQDPTVHAEVRRSADRLVEARRIEPLGDAGPQGNGTNGIVER
jgi:hypothetical protein